MEDSGICGTDKHSFEGFFEQKGGRPIPLPVIQGHENVGIIEEIKGEQKQKLWQDRLKGYYQPTLDIAEQGLALKKAAAELAAEGKDGLSIYDDILLTNSTSLRDPFTKRDILRSLTGKNLQVEGEKNKKTLNSKENKGLIFIDIRGNVVRNKGDGTTEDVDETRDEFFTWRN